MLLHGFDGEGAKDVRELAALRRATGGRTVGLYAAATHADLLAPGAGTVQTSIDDLAAAVAALITAGSHPVDLVGHSMGGLVAARTRQLASDRVRRLVTLGAPFHGLLSAFGADVVQCLEMRPGSPWLTALHDQGIHVDLAVGSEADEAVDAASALDVPADRTLRLPAERGVHHGDLVNDAAILRQVRLALR